VSEAERLTRGSVLRGPTRCMTRERMRWYVDVLHSLEENDGTLHRDAPTNIHSGDEYARTQGLPGVIADGPISTNWLFGLLVDVFGPSALDSGRLSTKHIRPTLENMDVTTCLQVTDTEELADGRMRYTLDIWCEDGTQTKLTVGTAVVTAERLR